MSPKDNGIDNCVFCNSRISTDLSFDNIKKHYISKKLKIKCPMSGVSLSEYLDIKLKAVNLHLEELKKKKRKG